MLAIFLISLFAALLIGLPIAFSLLASGSIMMMVKGLFDSKVIAQQVLGGFNGFTLLAMPFFVLAGEAMNKGGISEAIVRAVMAIFGHIRGALGYVVIFSCMIFAGLSRSRGRIRQRGWTRGPRVPAAGCAGKQARVPSEIGSCIDSR